MDSRRFLIAALAGLSLSGCAVVPDVRTVEPAQSVVGLGPAEDIKAADFATSPPVDLAGAVAASPSESTAVPYWPAGKDPAAAVRSSPAVNAVAGPGMRVFDWSPGQVFEVRAAPLRVTTLTLGPGEDLVSKAAGDTVRWQIGEAASGEGAARRVHVLLKPLQRGLETNLVLTTNRRVYFIDLKSVAAEGFNPSVTWDEVAPTVGAPAAGEEPDLAQERVVEPQGPIDARYRIEPQGRRARWTPASVFNDGQRTFIVFDQNLRIDEAPALFVIAPDGNAQMVNYRQSGAMFIVDRVFERGELRLGDRHLQVVRIRWTGAGR